MPAVKSIEERLWEKVDKRPGGCWLWMGGCNKGKYGVIGVDGKTELVHRLSWRLHNGTIDGDVKVQQSCFVRNCVNPTHLYLSKKKVPAEVRFWLRVVKTADCWLWTAHIAKDGYGRFKDAYKEIYPHRFSWIVHFGAVPDGLDVLHKCDVRHCINPSHLFLGTDADNVADRVAKGRNGDTKGEKNSQAKMTSEKVIAMRLDRQTGLTWELLSKKYNISICQARQICVGRWWKHI